MEIIIEELFNTKLNDKYFYETLLNFLEEYSKFLLNHIIGWGENK